jgi:hypothetical protein
VPKMLLTVLADVVSPDRDDEFNDWYDTVHVPAVCEVPGVVSARRFRLAEQRSASHADVTGGRRYLVIYEVDTDDLAGLEAEMQARVADGRLGVTDAVAENPPPVALYFEQIG